MNVVKWNPIREMDDLLSRVVRGAASFPTLAVDGAAINSWVPAVDISENSKEYVVRAELPGLDRQDVKVSTQSGVLTISGERKVEKVDDDEQHHRVERYFGAFSRSFSIPKDVETQDISADCKHGVVTIRLHKSNAKKTKPQEITVH